MKLTAQDKSFAIVDEALDSSYFLQFWKYFNGLDFAYRSMSGWQKVWRINDGQVLSGSPYYNSQAPFNSVMDILQQTIYGLAKQNFAGIVGEEGKDWQDIVFTPYIYAAGTKISWHDDYGYTGAAIFYPHLEWNPHWGGELMIAKTPSYDELDLKNAIPEEVMTRDYISPILNAYGIGTYVAPLPNRIAFTSGEVWHQINRVDSSAGDHLRCSVVAFFLKEKVS